MTATGIARPEPVGSSRFTLGESPVWDDRAQRLTWVDLESAAVLSAPLLLGQTRARVGAATRFDLRRSTRTVGCAFPLDDGRCVVALDRALAIIGRDGSIARGSDLLPEGTRFNDGGIDPQGRLLVGTLTLEGPADGNRLLRLEADGSLTVLDDDLGLSNGLAWSPDGGLLYSIDTARRRIHRRRYGAVDGPREILVQFEDGVDPDGLTVDAAGDLWVAIHGGGRVVVLAPDGSERPGRALDVAAEQTSSVVFAGPDLDALVVSTGSQGLSESERRRWPHAGELFVLPCAGRGLPAHRWVEVPLP